MICRKCIVSGRVQGVFYRNTAKTQADLLGINGHAFNKEDGTVEVFMCGTEEQLKTMEDWLWEGSHDSKVNTVKCHTINSAIPQKFVIG